MNLILDKGDNQILKLVGCKAISSLEESKAQLEYLQAPFHQVKESMSDPIEERATCVSGNNSPIPKRKLSCPSTPISSKGKNREEEFETFDAGGNITSAVIEQRLNKMLTNPKQVSKYQTHFPRISAMSELLKISHFKTVKNIWISVLLIAIANTLLYNYFESGYLLGEPPPQVIFGLSVHPHIYEKQF